MLQDFTKRKFEDYLKIADFQDVQITFRKIKESSLPAYIINFFDCSLPAGKSGISKKEFEQLLKKAIVFNINYIIKPKTTLLKFLFNDVETRPADNIRDKLNYFQFYGYYINHINDFLTLNSPDTVSVNQVKHLIDEVNSKILSEINSPDNDDSQRLNLVKLLYYFFHDLPDNNPINIKIPKKLLSVFFQDKGFNEIKSRVDNFFKDEIFIQEAVELLNPASKKKQKTKLKIESVSSKTEVTEEEIKEIVSKAKITLKKTEPSVQKAERIKKAPEEDKNKEPIRIPEIRHITEAELQMPVIKNKNIIKDNALYSDDLLTASKEIIPEAEIAPSKTEINSKLISDIFSENSRRKKIIKKLFGKDEIKFNKTVSNILESGSWKNASKLISEYYDLQKIDYYSSEAVKFVDLLHSHFINTKDYAPVKKTGNDNQWNKMNA